MGVQYQRVDGWKDMSKEEYINFVGKEEFKKFEEKLDSTSVFANLLDFNTRYSYYNSPLGNRCAIDFEYNHEQIRICFMIIKEMSSDEFSVATFSIFALMDTEFYKTVFSKDWFCSAKEVEKINDLLDDLSKVLCLVKN